MQIHDLGLVAYSDAWKIQESAHEQVLAGGPEQVFLVEHPPVITCGRRPRVEKNLIASRDQRASLGVELIQSDRGGDITFHGPGQLVVYPIIRLADHGLSVSGYVHMLEKIIVASLAKFELPATTEPAAVGVWTPGAPACGPSKVCAIGVRIRRGVSMHGLALNVSGDLKGFGHIIPCGLPGRPVVSIAQILGDGAAPMAIVKRILISHMLGAFATAAAASDNGRRRA